MKILLTSQGLYNDTISKALFELLGKPANEIKVAFVPTAATEMDDDKTWMIDDLTRVRKQNFARIDIVDVSALPKEEWRPRLEKADLLFFGGGNPFFLMNWLKRTGLNKSLPELLKTRVYLGSSSGAMVLGKIIPISCKEFYESKTDETVNMKALGFFDFTLMPHYETRAFPKINKEAMQELANEIKCPIYGFDDDTAIKIDDEKFEIVSEGKWEKFN